MFVKFTVSPQAAVSGYGSGGQITDICITYHLKKTVTCHTDSLYEESHDFYSDSTHYEDQKNG